MITRAVCFALAMITVDVRELLAQPDARTLRTVARADSLLRVGRVHAAETLYYHAARRRPQDPAARLALGRYLAARGAVRVGSVLIEEARRFGASPTIAAIYLAPLYTRLGDWKSLSELTSAPLTAGERERLAWLVSRESAISGPDSAVVPLLPARTPTTLGSIVIRIGGDSVVADIDPDAHGLALDQSWRDGGGLRRFSGGSPDVRQAAGVIVAATIGSVRLTNLPIRFEALDVRHRARLGLDILLRLGATADPGSGQIVLRPGGRLPAGTRGVRHPLLIEAPAGARIVRGGRVEPIGRIAAEVRGRRWALDGRLGELVLGS